MTIINKKEAFRVLLSVQQLSITRINGHITTTLDNVSSTAKNSIFLLDSSDKYIIH